MTPLRNTLQLLSLPAVLLLFLSTACNDSSTGPGNEEEDESQIESYIVEDIPASDAITYYSLRDNSIVEASDSASTEWDIAFSTTTIYTNSEASGPGDGGALVLDVSFDDVTIAPSDGYSTDTDTLLAIPTGSGNGWYNYNRTTHIVTPIENKTLVIKTGDGANYAKLQVLSYYKGNPDLSGEEFSNNPDNYPSGYYTFEYVIQLNGSREFAE